MQIGRIMQLNLLVSVLKIYYLVSITHMGSEIEFIPSFGEAKNKSVGRIHAYTTLYTKMTCQFYSAP
jgi:hypothetical protein